MLPGPGKGRAVLSSWEGFMNRFHVAVIAALAIFSIAVMPAHADEKLVFGALLPLTGPAAPIGAEQQRGVDYAVRKINESGGIDGRKVEFRYEDSQGKPDTGVLSFNKLIDYDHVPAVISAFSSVGIAIGPIATRRETLVLNPGAQSDQLGDISPFLLNTIPLVHDETKVLARYIYDKVGARNVAVIYENAAAGTDGRNDFVEAFKKLGGTIVADEAIEFGQTNYRPTLLKVRAAKPDLVYLVVLQGYEPLIEQIGQIPGFPVCAGTTFLRLAWGHPEAVGWYQSAVHSEIDPKIEEEFKAIYKQPDMSFFGREYYTAANIIFEATAHVLKDGKDLTGRNLLDKINEIQDFENSVAKLHFDKSTNTAKRGIEVLKYTKTEREVVAVESAK
jgi:branched-chain amino acid transport system substrate-binding protein